MLQRLATIARSLLVHTLILGVSAAGLGLGPGALGAAQGNAAVALVALRQPCCCGSSDGRCCGRGCCVAPVRVPVRSEVPARVANGGQELIQLATLGSEPTPVFDGGVWRQRSNLSPGGELAAQSLQAQHVRIQT